MLLSCFGFFWLLCIYVYSHIINVSCKAAEPYIAVACWEITISQESAVPIFEFNGLDIENNQPSELWMSWRNAPASEEDTCRQRFQLAVVDAKPTLLTYSLGNLYLLIYCQATVSCIFCSVIFYIYSHTSVELLPCDLFLFSNKWALKKRINHSEPLKMNCKVLIMLLVINAASSGRFRNCMF